mgnify:CR=1 FL=1
MDLPVADYRRKRRHLSLPIWSSAVLMTINIALMVVLIVGLSVAGYIIYKYLGQNAGTVLGGVLGGLVSSTATTASFVSPAL